MKDSEKVKNTAPSGGCKEPAPGTGSDLGNICLHDNVISNLVRRAALAVDGVSRLAGSSLVDNLAELVGSRKMQDRAISIIKDEHDPSKVTIELKINMFFGYKVHRVAESVQRAVIEMVENTASVVVAAVNVAIQEIEDKPAASDEESGEPSEK